MADFLEERIDHQKIKMGAAFTDDYDVNVVTTSGGSEYRSLIHPYPRRTFDVSQLLEKEETYNFILALYHRAHGQYAGFRIKCYDEFSSNGATGTPTAFDQNLLYVSPGVYQLRKFYGKDKTAGASGYPYRLIKKPVSGTIKVAVSGIELSSTGNWSVDNTTGIVTFAQNNQGIFGISKEASAVITLNAGHGLSAGKSVYFSGVGGMTQINGLRGTIIGQTTYTITVDINSSGFSTWTSGGIVSQSPTSGETVTAGFHFDFPVRFNGNLNISQDYYLHRNVDGISLVELLNP